MNRFPCALLLFLSLTSAACSVASGQGGELGPPGAQGPVGPPGPVGAAGPAGRAQTWVKDSLGVPLSRGASELYVDERGLTWPLTPYGFVVPRATSTLYYPSSDCTGAAHLGLADDAAYAGTLALIPPRLPFHVPSSDSVIHVRPDTLAATRSTMASWFMGEACTDVAEGIDGLFFPLDATIPQPPVQYPNLAYAPPLHLDDGP